MYSCEIKDFVQTRLRKLRVMLGSRMSLGVCPHQGHRPVTSLRTTTTCTIYHKKITEKIGEYVVLADFVGSDYGNRISCN